MIRTIVDCLEQSAAHRGGALAYRYLDQGEVGGSITEIDNHALYARVTGMAAELGRALAPGDRAILLYPPGLDFVLGFHACLAAGVIAVPAFPPDPSALDRSLGRLRAIAADCDARAVITTRAVLEGGEGPFLRTGDLGFVHEGELIFPPRAERLLAAVLAALAELADDPSRPGSGGPS